MKQGIFAMLVACALCACARDLDDPRPLPALDEPYFRCRVQPVLARSCSQLACHGDARRPFRVFARNRLRAGGPESERDVPMRLDELAANFDAARAMVDPRDVDRSLLLTKPLDVAAGGAFHRGAELYGGGDVFLSRDDPEFQTLRAWVHGAKEDASCIEPGSSP